MKRHLITAVTLAAGSALVLSGCAGSDSGGGSGGGDTSPIVVGSINTNSGPAAFPEASEAAAAVFDAFNAEGGLDGRMIEYKTTDDKGDPATATASAREIVGSDEAVAMVAPQASSSARSIRRTTPRRASSRFPAWALIPGASTVRPSRPPTSARTTT